MHLLSNVLKILSYRGGGNFFGELFWQQLKMQELEEHAARCCGAEEEETTANCPICDLELQVELNQNACYSFGYFVNSCHFIQVEALEQHAATCAAAMFGS